MEHVRKMLRLVLLKGEEDSSGPLGHFTMSTSLAAGANLNDSFGVYPCFHWRGSCGSGWDEDAAIPSGTEPTP